MIDAAFPIRLLIRLVLRNLHVLAALTATATFLLLAIGQMVTSFRAGMADPIWPTEPWYLFSNYKLDFGYLIEHSHRIVGFTVGILATVLAFGLWLGGSCPRAKWVGVAGLLLLLAGYGELHRGLIAQRNVPAAQVTIPQSALGILAVGFVLVLGAALAEYRARSRWAGVRLLGVLALVCVMIQGLLGGFRVKLNELVGTDLAAFHGVFAQVVFGLLVSLAVLTARVKTDQQPPRSLRAWAAVLAGLLFVQVIWGAMVRHDPSPLTQKLHFLTAFLATAVAVWVVRSLFVDPAARSCTGIGAWLLCGLLVAQLYLGVEAWMEKFGAYTLPELVPITKTNATIRTLHALVGSGLLATAVGLAVRLKQAGCPQCPAPELVKDERNASAQVSELEGLALAHGPVQSVSSCVSRLTPTVPDSLPERMPGDASC
jgi:heme A synthase